MASRTRSATVVAAAVAFVLLILGVASQRSTLLILAGATAVVAVALAALTARRRPPVGQPGGPSESDLPTDDAVASTRATGGVPDPSAPDQHSTTGTTPSTTFVGRVSGTDPGATEQTGAEVRAEHNQHKRRPR